MLARDTRLAFASLDAASRRAQAIATSLRYCQAIARHDLDATVDCLDAGAAPEFHAWRRRADFQPLFDLWCDDQPRTHDLLDAGVAGGSGWVELRSDVGRFHICLVWRQTRWYVTGQTITSRIHLGAATLVPTPPRAESESSRFHKIWRRLRATLRIGAGGR